MHKKKLPLSCYQGHGKKRAKMPTSTVLLKRFPMGRMQRDALVGILGRRRQGKTRLMEMIAYEMQFERAAALCGTMGAQQGFLRFMDPEYVFKGSVAVLKQLLRAHSQWVLQHPDVPVSKFETAFFLDDMVFDDKFMRCQELKELALNGRQLGLFVCLAVQYMMEMRPSMRSSLDYILVTREINKSNRDLIYKFYLGFLPTRAYVDKFINKCTEDFGVMVVDSTETTTDVTRCLYHYRANPDLPKWKLGEPRPTIYTPGSSSGPAANQIPAAMPPAGANEQLIHQQSPEQVRQSKPLDEDPNPRQAINPNTSNNHNQGDTYENSEAEEEEEEEEEEEQYDQEAEEDEQYQD